MENIVESDENSGVDDLMQAWDSDQRERPEFDPQPSVQNECAIGHRVKASRSVLALALDDECVFAGLQGGDIVVSTSMYLFFREVCLGLSLSHRGLTGVLSG